MLRKPRIDARLECGRDPREHGHADEEEERGKWDGWHGRKNEK
jgi:hypothetical protein